MLKPIAAMTDHEMLVELMREKRRNDRERNIRYMIIGAVIVLIALLLFKFLPPVIHYFQALNETVDKVQAGIAEVQGVTDGIKNTITDMWDRFSTTLHWGTSGDPM
jgi:hypothetical protein